MLYLRCKYFHWKKMRVKSVSQLLLKLTTDKCQIKIRVDIEDYKSRADGFYSIYETDSGSYLSFNPNSCIVFQYKSQGAYDVNQTVKVTDDDLFSVTKGLKKFYQKLMRPDMFVYYKSGAISCEPRRDDTVVIPIRSGGFLEFEPAVIYDDKGGAFPGVNMAINIKENRVDMSIDEFETLLYKMSKIDIGSEAMKLINAYMLLEQRIERNKGGNYLPPQSTPESGKKINNARINIFQKKDLERNNQVDELVLDNRAIVNVPKSLDDL